MMLNLLPIHRIITKGNAPKCLSLGNNYNCTTQGFNRKDETLKLSNLKRVYEGTICNIWAKDGTAPQGRPHSQPRPVGWGRK